MPTLGSFETPRPTDDQWPWPTVGSPAWTQAQLSSAADWYQRERQKFARWREANALQMGEFSQVVVDCMWDAWVARAELESMPSVRFQTQFNHRP